MEMMSLAACGATRGLRRTWWSMFLISHQNKIRKKREHRKEPIMLFFYDERSVENYLSICVSCP